MPDIFDIAGDVQQTTSGRGSWQRYGKGKPIDYAAAEAQASAPHLLSDPVGWWASLTDEQKQEALNTLGELAGGTAGAVVGTGPMSIPAAGVGAVVGKTAARLAGAAAGIKSPPKTVMQELDDAAKTAVLNAGGEGAARALPLIPGAVKSVAQRGLQRVLKPEPEIVQLADKAGIALTPGMATRQPLIRQLEAVLETTPGGMQKIRDATGKAMAGSEQNIRAIPQKFAPYPVDRPEAGEALRDAVNTNFRAVEKHFDPQYKQLSKRVGDVNIDLTPMQDAAQQVDQGIPKELFAFFPQDTRQRVNQILNAGAVAKTKPTGLVDPSGSPLFSTGRPKAREYILGADGKTAVPLQPDAALTFDQARKLRTELLGFERQLSRTDTPYDREAIPKLRAALDDAIDQTLGQRAPEALADWRGLNSQYRESVNKLLPPASSKATEGNRTAGAIANEKLNPDAVVTRVANSPTAVREADIATTPMYGAEDANAMNKLRRNRADELLQESRTKHPWNTEDQLSVNPDVLEKRFTGKDGISELLAPANLEFQDAVKLGKAVEAPSKYRNTSKTAIIGHFLNYGPLVGGALAGGVTGEDVGDKLQNAAATIAGGYALPKLAAKAWTGPIARAVTSPTMPLMSRPLAGPMLGAAGRAVMDFEKLPEGNPVPIEDLLKPKRQRDIFDQIAQ